MGICILPVCVCPCTTCLPGVLRGQKRVWGPLNLELQRVASCHTGAENESQDPVKGRQCFNPWALSPAPLVPSSVCASLLLSI